MNVVWTLALREVVHFSRARARLLASIATPAMFWMLVGTGFTNSAFSLGQATSVGYSEYFFTGALAMVMLFSSIFSAFSLIEDRNEGFLQGVLVSPAHSWEIVLGKVLGGTLLSSFQGACFLMLAPLAGVPLTPVGLALTLLAIVLTAFSLASLGICVAWPSRSISGFHAVMNLVMMPMWLLSGALFPAQGAHPLMRLAIQLNPFTYCVEGLRHGLYYGSGDPPSGALIGAILLFAASAFALAVGVAHSLRQPRS